MADKKLVVTISAIDSEATKNEILALVPASSKKAASIIRGANGKVIMVVIKLPATASEAAREALARTPGVSGVSEGDLPAGTIGTDFTEESYTQLLTSGFTETLTKATKVFNQDGTMTVTLSPGSTRFESASYDLRKYTDLPNAIFPPLPLRATVDLRIKLDTLSSAYINCGAWSYGVPAGWSVVPGDGIRCSTESVNEVVVPVSEFTNAFYKLSIVFTGVVLAPDTYEVKFYVNDSLVKTASSSRIFWNELVGADVTLNTLNATSSSVTIDYWRWTQP